MPALRGPRVDGDRGWPFVGRVNALTELRRALGDLGAVVSGPAGIGKSALIARGVPRPAARIVATPAGKAMPLWALESLIGERPAPHALPDVLVRHLTARHGGPGLPILVIENIDHLDDPSLAIVVHLISQRSVRIAASRSDIARPPDSVRALWREAGLHRIDLGPLDEDEVAELLRQALGGPLDGRSAAVLTDLAGGIPWLIRDLVVGARASGTLVPVEGLWCLVGVPAVGPDLVDRVASDLSRLDDDQVAAIELLAFGGPLPPELADQVIDPSVSESLERRRILSLRDDRGQTVMAITSPLVAEVVNRGIPRGARRRLASRLAAAAEAIGTNGSALEVRTVTWLLDAGAEVDAERALAAARAAVEGGDPTLAERLAAASAAKVPSTEAALLESWCAEESGRREHAEQVLTEHRPVGDEAATAIAIRRAEQQFWGRRDKTAADAILDEQSLAVADPWCLAAEAQRGLFEGLDGKVDAALDRVLPLVDHPTHMVLSTASLAAAFSLTAADRAVEAKAVAESALQLLAGPSPALFIDSGVQIIGVAFAMHGAGEFLAADELLAEVYRFTLGRAGRQAQGWAALLRAHVLAARGRPIPAMEAAVEAEQVWVSARLDGPARWSATVAALALADTGDVDELEQALRRVDAYDPVPFRLFDPETARAHAWLRFHRADPQAPAAFEAAAVLARSTGRIAMAAAAAHDLVRIGEPARATQILASLPPGSAVTSLRRDLAQACCEGNGHALLSVADGFAAMGADGWAVEARALARPFQPASAALLRIEVERMASEHGLATPPVRSLVERPEPNALTSREAEVVRLAANGTTNRAIAGELVVSLRTVENHLHRAFTKLGVTSRSELAVHLATG